jgi:hypothetical protein
LRVEADDDEIIFAPWAVGILVEQYLREDPLDWVSIESFTKQEGDSQERLRSAMSAGKRVWLPSDTVEGADQFFGQIGYEIRRHDSGIYFATPAGSEP